MTLGVSSGRCPHVVTQRAHQSPILRRAILEGYPEPDGRRRIGVEKGRVVVNGHCLRADV
jgi:hypothetical protein